MPRTLDRRCHAKVPLMTVFAYTSRTSSRWFGWYRTLPWTSMLLLRRCTHVCARTCASARVCACLWRSEHLLTNFPSCPVRLPTFSAIKPEIRCSDLTGPVFRGSVRAALSRAACSVVVEAHGRTGGRAGGPWQQSSHKTANNGKTCGMDFSAWHRSSTPASVNLPLQRLALGGNLLNHRVASQLCGCVYESASPRDYG